MKHRTPCKCGDNLGREVSSYGLCDDKCLEQLLMIRNIAEIHEVQPTLQVAGVRCGSTLSSTM